MGEKGVKEGQDKGERGYGGQKSPAKIIKGRKMQ